MIHTFPILQSHKTKTINLTKHLNYHVFGSRETCLVRDEPWVIWLIQHELHSFIDVPNKNVYDYYVEEKSFLTLLKQLERKLMTNWISHLHDYPVKKRELIKRSDDLAKSISSNDSKLIAQRYHQYLESAYVFDDYVWGAWAVIYHTEPEVMKIFPNKIELIASLEKPIEYFKMKKDLFYLSVNSLIKHYSWLNIYSPFDQPYSKADFRGMKNKESLPEIEQQFHKFSLVKRKFITFLTSLKNNDLRRKVEMVHTYAWLKTDRIDAWRQSMLALKDFYQYLCTLSKGLSLRETCNLFIHEIMEILKGEKFPSSELLKLRSQNRALYYFDNNSITEINNQRKITQTIHWLEKNRDKVEKLTGTVACQGKVTGIVKIITSVADLKKITKGDIFVAKFTYPTFTPYMLKSAAIITDEGGITTHAAIISREYNIPCIVGTKIATEILKDGDIIKVDANKGIIRRINVKN